MVRRVLPGIFLALVTSLSWAGANIFIQRTGQALGSVRALLWSFVVSAAIAGTIGLCLEGIPTGVTTRTWLLLLLAGVSGLVGYAGMFYAFAKATLTVAVPVITAWPLVSALFAIVVLDEHPSSFQLVAAAVVFAGVMVVAIGSTLPAAGAKDSSELKPRAGTGWPLVAAFAAVLGFGIMVPALGQVAPSVGELNSSACIYIICILLGLPLARAAGVRLAPPPPAWRPSVLAIALGETIGLVSVAMARRFAPIAVVAPISSLAAAFTLAYAWVFLGERQNRWILFGAVLASVGVVLLSSS